MDKKQMDSELALLEIETLVSNYTKTEVDIFISILCARIYEGLELGIFKRVAREYPMHSQKNYRNRVIYYLDTDVVKMDGNDIPKNCLTCNYRSEQSFCVIAGDYVGEINRCSEWESKYAQ